MSVPKYKTFFNNVNSILNMTNKNQIKTTIGDSTNNHRTVSVVQFIRFLEAIGEDVLATQTTLAYNNLYEVLQDQRDYRGVVRRDGFDITEFLNTYEEVVIENSDFRPFVFRNIA